MSFEEATLWISTAILIGSAGILAWAWFLLEDAIERERTTFVQAAFTESYLRQIQREKSAETLGNTSETH